MPYLSDRQTVGIGAVVANVLQGKFGRVLGENSKVSVAITAELISLFATVLVGSEIIIEDQEVPNTNASPRNPEDVLVQTVGQVGDEIIVKVRNANLATNDSRVTVFLEPI